MTATWVAILLAAGGCYALKLAGVALPASVLADPRVARVAELLPVAMLAALVATQLLDAGGRWGGDWRPAVGVAVGALLLLLTRAGVLTVFVVAAAVTAVLRLVS